MTEISSINLNRDEYKNFCCVITLALRTYFQHRIIVSLPINIYYLLLCMCSIHQPRDKLLNYSTLQHGVNYDKIYVQSRLEVTELLYHIFFVWIKQLPNLFEYCRDTHRQALVHWESGGAMDPSRRDAYVGRSLPLASLSASFIPKAKSLRVNSDWCVVMRWLFAEIGNYYRMATRHEGGKDKRIEFWAT